MRPVRTWLLWAAMHILEELLADVHVDMSRRTGWLAQLELFQTTAAGCITDFLDRVQLYVLHSACTAAAA